MGGQNRAGRQNRGGQNREDDRWGSNSGRQDNPGPRQDGNRQPLGGRGFGQQGNNDWDREDGWRGDDQRQRGNGQDDFDRESGDQYGYHGGANDDFGGVQRSSQFRSDQGPSGSAQSRGSMSGRSASYGRSTSNQGGEYGSEDSSTWSSGQSSNRWDRQRGGQHSGKGPKGYQRSDERIREDVSEALAQHGDIDASDIEVEVKDGEVTLSGTVQDRESKRAAEEAAEECSGVKDVQNRIRVHSGSTSERGQFGQGGQGNRTSAQGNSGSTGTSSHGIGGDSESKSRSKSGVGGAS